jgi:hypothetical protein
MKTKKSTNEIRALLKKVDIDFDSAVNIALNDYIQKIFLSCPFTEEICLKKQCLECDSSRISKLNAMSKIKQKNSSDAN